MAIRYIGPDPRHVRPAPLTADGLRHDLQGVHGQLMRLERTAPTSQAASAFHAALNLVAGVLWPGASA